MNIVGQDMAEKNCKGSKFQVVFGFSLEIKDKKILSKKWTMEKDPHSQMFKPLDTTSKWQNLDIYLA